MARSVVFGAACATCIRYMADLSTYAGRIIANRSSDRDGLRGDSASCGAFHQHQLEHLEARQLLSSVTFSGGVLTITGNTNVRNSITVFRSGSSNVVGKVGGTWKTVPLSSLNKIVVYGQNWNDTISIDSGITKPAWIDGRNGNDSIIGGSGNDTLYGDLSNDSLYGGAGNDFLYGEAGNDRLDGGSGTDRLDGGSGSNSLYNGESTAASAGALPTGSSAVNALTLYNADTNQPVQTLTNGTTIDLAKLPAHLTVLASTAGSVKSVKFGYDSNSTYRKENALPWSISGDYSSTDVATWSAFPTSGTHKITATPYSSTNATGTAGSAKSVSFTVIRSGSTAVASSPPTSSSAVTALTLYNADTNKAIQTINSGATLDLAKLPSHLTVTASTSGTVRSVKFGYDSNSTYRKENALPWSISGDYSSTDVATWSAFPTSGTHTITATPYSATNATGSVGSSRTVSFNVIRSSTTSGGSTSTSGTSGGTTTTTGGIVPRDTSASAPNAVISATTNRTIHAGQAVHFNAMSSQLNDGTPITARYVWNFGDSGSKYNTLVGFNAAHIYERSGTFTVTLTVTNEAGKTDTATTTVSVQAEDRRKYYVSSSGSDSNDGLSTAHPLKTFAKAMTKLTDNTEILFQAGDTFTVTKGFIFIRDNVVIGSYGTGSKPVLKFTGPYIIGTNILTPAGGSDGVSIEGLKFDSSYTSYETMPGAVAIGGTAVTVKNCEFGNLSDGINNARQPHGVLAQDNYAGTSLRGYFAWVQGTDQVYLGNTIGDSKNQHVLRTAGAERILIADNNFTNHGTDVIKGTLTIHKGDYIYIADNTLSDGKVSIGPLGEGDGLDDKSARLRYVVLEGNNINSPTIIDHGSEHIMIRNNVMKDTDGYAINIIGYNSTYGRGVVDCTIVNNTGENDGNSGQFIHLGGSANGIAVVNNLYLAKNLVTGTLSTASVYVSESALNSFSKITNNVWANATPLGYAQGGQNYIYTYWSNSAGYKTPTEWNSYGQVGTDYFEDTSTSSLKPTSGHATNSGILWAGVFVDKNGALRSPSGSWAIGAVN